jgi:PleD family two-component response regulator
MGITAYDSTQNLTIENLLQQADQALYGAKKNGRNCVQEFSATGHPSPRMQPISE